MDAKREMFQIFLQLKNQIFFSTRKAGKAGKSLGIAFIYRSHAQNRHVSKKKKYIAVNSEIQAH